MIDQNIGIYIHIPFCVKKCNYCDFVSGAFDDSFKEEYINRLCREIEDISLDYKSFNADSIFVGGGTPSILSEKLTSKLFDTLYKCFNVSSNAEITTEANPGTLNLDKLKLYKSIGVNRLSIGLQSTNDNELRILGRIHTYNDFLENYECARNAGFENINVDLMSALPGQKVDSFVDSLNNVLKLSPEHISVYSLIIEEGTPFYNMNLDLPDEDDERKMVHVIPEILGTIYSQYEISNYAKRGMECRHNIKYWKREPYLGFGPSAASLTYSNSSIIPDLRYKNTSDIRNYTFSNEIIHDEYEILTYDDMMSEYMFLGLRMNCGIKYSDFQRIFNKNINEVFGKAVFKHVEEGLLIIDKDRLFLSETGRDLSNYVFADFLM